MPILRVVLIGQVKLSTTVFFLKKKNLAVEIQKLIYEGPFSLKKLQREIGDILKYFEV